MRVLILHNRYREPGGEDCVARAEAQLLRDRNVDVLYYDVGNPAPGTLAESAQAAWTAGWSWASYRKVRELCARYQPDVAHVHNFWMALSPSVHAACRDAGTATVQTLHNFRLLCLNALFLRDGKICEDCLGKSPWRGVLRRCYRKSFLASAAVARMIVGNRDCNTWAQSVDAFIALSKHSRTKFITGGLPAERIFVKGNFVEDPGPPTLPPSASQTLLYAGRLSQEKGLSILLRAWARVAVDQPGRLVIAGDGPERTSLEMEARALGLSPPRLAFVGLKGMEEIQQLVSTARAVLLPSICFENFPRILVEAFSHGRPAVVSGQGAAGEIVRHRRQGLHFAPGDPDSLAVALARILSEPALADRLGQNARIVYLARYTPNHCYHSLLRIYRFAIHRRRRDSADGSSSRGAEPGRPESIDPVSMAA